VPFQAGNLLGAAKRNRPQRSREIKFSDYYTPHETQAIGHAAPEQFIVYGGAVGGGKSWFGCGEMIQLCLDFPGAHVLVARYESASYLATTARTLDSVLPPELVAETHKSVPMYRALINGSIIFEGGLKTTRQEDPLSRIKSMELTGFFVDEATDLPREVYTWLISRLRWRNVKKGIEVPQWRMRGVLTCNPERGWIHDEIVRPQMEGRPKPNTLFLLARTAQNTKLDPAYLDMLRQNFPAEWQRRYMDGEWEFAEDDWSILPFHLAREAADREPERGRPMRLGVDVARFGGAETNIACREGNHVSLLKTFAHTDLATARVIIGDTIDSCRARNGGKRPVTAIDTVGLGAGIYDELRKQGFPVIEAIAGAKAHDDKRFANASAEWWWHVRQSAEAGELSLQRDETLLSQLSSRHWHWDEKRIGLESKDQMVSRGIKSPDRADAVVMTWCGCCAMGSPGVRTFEKRAATPAEQDTRPYGEVIAERLTQPRFWGN